MHYIEARQLVPGRGEPIPDGRVVIEGDRITFAGPAATAPPPDPDAQIHAVDTVMPGLWDCHTHVFGLTTPHLGDLLHLPLPVAAARAVADLGAALRAGVTSVREMGGLGLMLARVVDEGTIDGPSIYAAGAVLSPTGGHADVHAVPRAWVMDFARAGGSLQLCDGVPECLRGVRLQLREGAKLIKVCVSGGVLSEIDDPIHQQFSDEELHAIVAEAARAERIVAVHCHGKPGMMAALAAGVHTIEHGSYLDAEAAELMKARGAILIPTRTITERVLEHGAALGMSAWALEKMAVVGEQQRAATRLAIEAGVTIAAGTDSLSTGPDTLSPWGQHGREPGYLVAAGMTPLQAIEAATATGPLTLGPQAPRSGQLRASYDADVIAVDGDPVQDIELLGAPERIVKVFRRGKLVKDLTPPT